MAGGLRLSSGIGVSIPGPRPVPWVARRRPAACRQLAGNTLSARAAGDSALAAELCALSLRVEAGRQFPPAGASSLSVYAGAAAFALFARFARRVVRSNRWVTARTQDGVQVLI